MAGATVIYPLEQVLDIKKRRVEEAERLVNAAREELKKQEAILKEKEKARDQVLQHRNDKLAQIRREMDLVDETTTTVKLQQMKDYLKVVARKLEEEEKKVAEQKKVVKEAEVKLQEAKDYLKLKQLEVDKLNLHKEGWVKEAKLELQYKEDIELDEIGSIIYQTRSRRS